MKMMCTCCEHMQCTKLKMPNCKLTASLRIYERRFIMFIPLLIGIRQSCQNLYSPFLMV